MKIRGEGIGIAEKWDDFVQEIKGSENCAQKLVVYARIIKLVKWLFLTG